MLPIGRKVLLLIFDCATGSHCGIYLFWASLKWQSGTIGLGLVSIKAHYKLSLSLPSIGCESFSGFLAEILLKSLGKSENTA